MDKILSYWAEKEDAFPEAMRMREETGCCFNATWPYAEETASPHELPA